MPKYTKKRSQNNDIALFIDGLQSTCPFIQPIVIGQSEQSRIVRIPCTNTCPHASFDEQTWLITCSGKSLAFKLEETVEEVIEPVITTQEETKIIKM